MDLESRLRAEGLDPGRWSNGPGDRYGAHEHDYDKVIVVERGSIRFRVGREGSTTDALDLSPGDRLELPAGTTHDALVGADGVGCLEAHRAAGVFSAVARRAGRGDGSSSGPGVGYRPARGKPLGRDRRTA